jgi:hypothetical protein
LIKPLAIAATIVIAATPSFAQPCPDVRTAQDRHGSALLLARCLGDPDPKVRDALAFEALSSLMRSAALEQRTLTALKAGESDRLARAVVFIAQRKLYTDAEWRGWFATVMDPNR